MTTREFLKPDYTYRVRLDRVIDGDTIDVHIDLGFYTWTLKRLRFLNVDTEELRSSDPERKQRAYEAKAYVENILHMAEELYVQTQMDATGKYGRLLADVWYLWEDGEMYCLNEQLVEKGYQKAPK